MREGVDPPRPSVNYYGDVNTLVVCDEAKRKQLIEQRQRLLEQEATGRVIEVNAHKAKEAVPVALPKPETHSSASVDTGKAIAARNQRPSAKEDPLAQWRDSVGRAASWKTNQPENNAASFAPHPEEIY